MFYIFGQENSILDQFAVIHFQNLCACNSRKSYNHSFIRIIHHRLPIPVPILYLIARLLKHSTCFFPSVSLTTTISFMFTWEYIQPNQAQSPDCRRPLTTIPIIELLFEQPLSIFFTMFLISASTLNSKLMTNIYSQRILLVLITSRMLIQCKNT